MASEDQPSTSDALGRLSRNVTLLGTVIAAVVAMNTALTTCTNETAARYQTFRQAVNAEEMFWQQRFSDYLSAFGRDVTPQERQAKLFALAALAQRDIPSFEEYRLGLLDDPQAKRLATLRLAALRSRLNQALDREQSSDPDLVAERRDERFAAAVATRVQARAGLETSPAPDSIPTVDATPIGSTINYQTQVLARGDPQGWDVDIFWCAGGGPQVEAANYASGVDSARLLGQLSQSGTRIAGDQLLGRIRLVTLPEARQVGIYPTRGAGNQVRGERTELSVADAIVALLNQPQRGYTRLLSDMRTTWYLSVFACRTGGPPVPQAQASVRPARAS